MICEKHNRFYPTVKCPQCEKERKELEFAIRMAEIENSMPIVLWEGQNI